MATIIVDGKTYEVNENQNLLHACLSLGLNLEYFCWHPALGSVGACRQCAVKQYWDDDDDKDGMIIMACMTPAEDGMRISIEDPDAVAFRAQIIEWLMVNHPHDCPICDEGGECHLQDMTVMSGHTYRRYRFNKRTYRNQYLGPFINHEMNRCIQCYRCVRYYQDYAGGKDLDVFGAHDHVYFGRHQDGVLQSEFSGNLVEVCPTGVFTDKTLKRHYTRKWDLTTAPSICVNCAVGCNTIPGERYGELRRIRNRYNREVNGYFLCDRGRYGYEFVNSDHRLRAPLIRNGDKTDHKTLSRQQALDSLAETLDLDKAIGIGSPRASLEANFALLDMVGGERFFAGISEKEKHLVETIIQILREGPARSPSLHDVESADVVLILGEDLTNTAPMLALAVRQAIRNRPIASISESAEIPKWQDASIREAIQDEKGPLYVATPAGTKLDDVATQTYRGAPEDLARLGFAIAHALDPNAPQVTDLAEEMLKLAVEIAQELKDAERPLVISGTSCGSVDLLQAAANVSWALCGDGNEADLCYTMPESNSFGLGLFQAEGLQASLQLLETDEVDTVVILENDIYRRATPQFVDKLIESARLVIAIDHLENPTTLKADLVFPAATFAEGDGSLVNNEARAQRFLQVFVPQGEIQESWRWVRDLTSTGGRENHWEGLDDVIRAMSTALPVFEPVGGITPPERFRVAGQKVPRQPHRYSGRTAMHSDQNVHEPKPPADRDTPLSFSMEGYKGNPPPALIPRYWAPGWNSVQALTRFQEEVAGRLRGGDPGKRLIEPVGVDEIRFHENVPEAFEPREDEWLIVPLFHIFGSEELSAHSDGIAELAPSPYLALNPKDGEKLEIEGGDLVELSADGSTLDLVVKLLPELPPGISGLPVGLASVSPMELPQWGRLRKGDTA